MPGQIGFSGHHWLLQVDPMSAREVEYKGGQCELSPSRSGFLLCCLLADDDMGGW